MKKILLIEDRYKRQANFLDQNYIDLSNYPNILDNTINEAAANILEDITNNSFDFSIYDIVICHKSVQNNTIVLSNLKEYCKTNQKTLILFSGGISVNYYDNSEFEYLELNSKTFYSQNLVLFLEAVKDETEDIMMLCYGEHWKQNIVASILEKTNLFIFDIKSGFENPVNFQIEINLSKTKHEFYELKEKNLEEIIKFKQSLEEYFTLQLTQKSSSSSIIIHHDNVCDLQIFNHHIKFIQSNDEIDTYISNIIKELDSKEFDTIFIKDNLSTNYLELYALRVAYHIRLSSELERKRFSPIVIISDFDEITLNKFTKEANILFTQGIYLCKNTKEDIQKYQSLDLKGVSNYDDFLSQIEVSPPKDTSGSHDIANKWSIYRWAEFLDAKGDAITKNKENIENELYFKYLKTMHSQKDVGLSSIRKPTKKGKVLLIDDEWDKGWSDILQNALTKDGLRFDLFDYNYKDKTQFNLYMQIQKKIKEFDPDVVVLDLRLSQNDHENDDIDSYTGIKILQKIHEINAGIQVIMLTATSKSTILEKLYEKKILGYVKKEHPEDKNIDTIENINKFIRLIDEGLKRKYLKSIWDIKQKINTVLEYDIFNQYNLNFDKYEKYLNILKNENVFIFDILDSNNKNSLAYASLSMARFLEAILSIFIIENKNTFWDDEECKETTVYKQLQSLIEKLDSEHSAKQIINSDLNNLIYKRNKYLHANKNIEFSKTEIPEWFELLNKIISIIENPPNLKIYNKGDINNLIHKFN